ncbi:Glucan endo-1,3-alpha-glucosidase agn1 [Grifola frondosa]|uniref:Glucan endo-1,3-alpha-glucosidase agn1 n=1 Tax=Grifola frondosa TaxID=5627 RepID=A0A1C7LYC6_GRIFR|nr:Glucan endo-1,3-alpha-glucosidase agn1 [Grifola frondosa]
MAENWTTLHAPRKRKWVVAHFMVGNTFPYRMEDWINDIRMAHAHGIDGFALNVGREDWQRHRVSDCYEAALQAEVPFKLFLSFDMTSIPASCQGDICVLNDYVAAFAKHPSQLLYEGKALVSTFAGKNSLFGFSNLSAAWRYAKAVLEQTAPIHLVPSFFINPGRYPEIHAMDGYFNWNGSWPLHLTPRSPRDEIECPRLDTDYHHLHHLGGRTFMAAVSPWFFTHYGIDSWNKNWVYRGDDWLFVRRWEQLIAMRERVDIVQIISWNDYGESHYIGPIKGAQPNSEAWVDGFPHEAWLHLNGYYAKAFKDGRYPKIEGDRIYMWSRPHLKEARAPDTVPRPDNWELADDAFWVVVFAVAPATIRLSTSDEDHAQSVAVQAGVSKLSHRMVAGDSMKGQLFRAGVLVTECAPSSDDFCFREHPQVYNFNAYVAMSSV